MAAYLNKSLAAFSLWLIFSTVAAQESLLGSMHRNGVLRFAAVWDTTRVEPLFVTIRETRVTDNKALPERILRICNDKFESADEIGSLRTVDVPISLSVFGSHRHLASVWESGSGYHVRIYVAHDGEVALGIEVGSDIYPEFLSDALGNEVLIVKTGKHGNSEAKIYSFTHGQYRLINSAPWNKRFASIPD